MISRIPLDNICDRKIETLSSHYDGKIEYIDISSIDNIEKTILNTQLIDSQEAPSRAKQLVKKGDILVSTVRPNLNAVAVVEKESAHVLVASTGYCVLRCNSTANNHYVFHFCQSPYFIEDMVRQATGASYPAVTNSIVKNSLIPSRNLEEQKHIATVLDKISDLIALRKKQLDKLDELVKTRFVEMFGDPKYNNRSFSTAPMTELCEIIDGDRGKNYPKQDEFSKDGYCLFLNAKNVTSSGFNFENCLFITQEKDLALHNGKLQRGDVVLTTRGTLGNLAFYTDEVPYEHIRINSGMVILRMNRNLISEVFFIEQFKIQLETIKQKVASGSAQPQLPISTMNQIMMIFPEVSLQNHFEKFASRVENEKLTIRQGLDKLEMMKKALMQQYFG